MSSSRSRGAGAKTPAAGGSAAGPASSRPSQSSSNEAEVNRFLGRRLLERRRLLSLTQAELGRAVGVGFQQIHKYETGASRMTPERLLTLAAALGVGVNYFFEGVPTSAWSRDGAGLASPPAAAARPRRAG